MSSNDHNDDLPEEYRGPSVPTGPRHAAGMRTNASLSRRELASFGRDLTIGPQLWDAVNYPTKNELTFNAFLTRYRRTGPGHGIVNKFAEDTWQELPDVTDDGESDDSSESETQFEKDVREFFQRRGLRGSPKQWFRNADKMSQLGQYSVIVFGFNDEDDIDSPITGAEDDDDGDGPLEGLEDLSFIAVYDEGRVEDIDEVGDINDPRYRLPESYEIQVSDDDVDTIHWTRSIHIPQNVFDDPLRGEPLLKAIFHELLNIDKILAASGEGYWRGAYQGIVVQPPMGKDGTRISAMKQMDSSSRSELVGQIDDFLENYNRLLTTSGEVSTLDVDISNPTPHLESQYRSIATALDAPGSVLMGNETGERATQEDLAMWHEKISSRRSNFAEDVILRPVIDRLVDVGVISEPEGDTYSVEWPPLDEPSEQEISDRRNTDADTLDKLSGGMPDTIASVGERRQLIGWGAEIGSEEPDDVNTSRENAELDESNEDVQKQFESSKLDPATADDIADRAATDGGSTDDQE